MPGLAAALGLLILMCTHNNRTKGKAALGPFIESGGPPAAVVAIPMPYVGLGQLGAARPCSTDCDGGTTLRE
jgi:hypothetical protein